MADPYALLAQSDARASNAFESINRNAIAGFNAEAEAAKFGFQATMQVAQFDFQKTQQQFENDMATQGMNLKEKELNQRMSIAKLGMSSRLAAQDRAYNHNIAKTAQENLKTQLDALGVEEEAIRNASLSGDPDAADKMSKIQAERQRINSELGVVFGKLKVAMDGGNASAMLNEVNRVDSVMSGDIPELPDPETDYPDSALESIGEFDDPIGSEESAELDGMVLPPRNDVPASTNSPQTLSGPTARTTEPMVNTLVTANNKEKTAQMRDLFPASLNEVAKKAASHFGKFLEGLGPHKSSTPARVSSGVGEQIAQNPRNVPDGGIVELSEKETNHFRTLIGMDPEGIPAEQRAALAVGKRRAYASLLQAGEPSVVAQYNDLYDVATNPNFTASFAEGQLDQAIGEGMITTAQKNKWLLEKARNEATKGHPKDPNADPLKRIDGALGILAKLKELESTGTAENPKTPIRLDNQFREDAIRLAQGSMARFTIDSTQQELLDRIAQERTNPTTPDAMNALRVELGQSVVARGRMFASEQLPKLNEAMRANGGLQADESAISLAKDGQAKFIEVVASRIQANGTPRAEARAIANTFYVQYKEASNYVTEERGADGAILKAPSPLEWSVRPASRASDTVVDNTMMAGVRGFFGGNEAQEQQGRLSGFRNEAGNVLRGLDPNNTATADELANIYENLNDPSQIQEFSYGLERWTPAEKYIRGGVDPEKARAGYNSLQEVATRIADASANSVFSKGSPNKAEVDSLRNDIESFNIPGRFDLADRTDYHNALKRVIALKILNRETPAQ